MTGYQVRELDTLTDDEQAWLEQVRVGPQIDRPHECGNCKTPFGRSALPCPNDRSAGGA